MAPEEFSLPLAIKEYSKEQEIEADNEAVGALRRLGVSPKEYVAVLKKLQEYTEKNGHDSGGGLMDDHPSAESRIEKIEKMHFSPYW